MKKRGYLFLNGELLGNTEYFKKYIKTFPGDIFCADGGYYHSLALSLTPLEIWGDMDSISEEIKSTKEYKSIHKKEFSAYKDNSDGELILEYLNSLGYSEIILIGGLGGKKSHELTNINLLIKYPNIKFITEFEEISLVTSGKEIEVEIGSTISFIPLSEIENLTLYGTEYPLEKYKLLPGDSRCLSNIAKEKIVKAEFLSGNLILVKENS